MEWFLNILPVQYIHVDCKGLWLSGGCSLVIEQWQLKQMTVCFSTQLTQYSTTLQGGLAWCGNPEYRHYFIRYFDCDY